MKEKKSEMKKYAEDSLKRAQQMIDENKEEMRRYIQKTTKV